MKTKITQNLDGYKIIIGIGSAEIDGEATRPIVNEKIIDTDEFKAVKSKHDDIHIQYVARREALANYKSAKTQSDKQKYTYEYQKAVEEIKRLEDELKPLAVELKNKHVAMMHEHAVYFNYVNASVITDEEAEIISNAMANAEKAGKHLDADLNLICDNRGLQVFKKSDKWYSRLITKIGDEPGKGEIISTDLTAEQIEEIKTQEKIEAVAKLSPSEKQAEYNKAVSILQEQAALKKSGLVISGIKESDATTQAGEWYQAELKKLNLIYA